MSTESWVQEATEAMPEALSERAVEIQCMDCDSTAFVPPDRDLRVATFSNEHRAETGHTPEFRLRTSDD